MACVSIFSCVLSLFAFSFSAFAHHCLYLPYISFRRPYFIFIRQMNRMKITFSIKPFHILSHVLRRVLSLYKTLRTRASGRHFFPTFACLCTKTTSTWASGTDFHTSTTLLDLWDSSMTVGDVCLCETDTKWVKTVSVCGNQCGCVVAVHSVRGVCFCRVKKNNVMQTMLEEEL